MVYRARELLPAHEPSETDNHWQEAAPATYILKLYLQESWFLAFKVGPRVQQAFVWLHSKSDLRCSRLSFGHTTPNCRPSLEHGSCVRSRGSRPSASVELHAIVRCAILYCLICLLKIDTDLAQQKDKQILQPLSGGSRDLALPSANLVKCDDEDVRF